MAGRKSPARCRRSSRPPRWDSRSSSTTVRSRAASPRSIPTTCWWRSRTQRRAGATRVGQRDQPSGNRSRHGRADGERPARPRLCSQTRRFSRAFLCTPSRGCARTAAGVGCARAGNLGIVLKIESRPAFDRFPLIMIAAMRHHPVEIMVARGDLAIELGFERLAEVQEEILWLSEAAHIPVIWATQVLETLAKTGVPSRAEVTDAATGVRHAQQRRAYSGRGEVSESRAAQNAGAPYQETVSVAKVGRGSGESREGDSDSGCVKKMGRDESRPAGKSACATSGMASEGFEALQGGVSDGWIGAAGGLLEMRDGSLRMACFGQFRG